MHSLLYNNIMKLIIGVLLVNLKFILSGSLHNGVRSETGLPSKFYTIGQSYEDFNAEFTANNVPYWKSYAISHENSCTHRLTEEIIADFRVNIVKFITLVFKRITALSEGHFVFSPYTAWLSLAALAEGSAETTRQKLLNILNLPQDKCHRLFFYRLATTREIPRSDVILARHRLFITDSSVLLNRNWEYFARAHTQLSIASIPYKTNPVGELQKLKQIFKAQLPNINLSGNSFLLESLDYHGLWSSAFSKTSIETGAFYDTFGKQIGTMEYMKTFQRVNIAYLPSTNMKMIEIPMGIDGHYKMILAISLEKEDYARSLTRIQDNLLFETLYNLKQTPGPIEIVIPRLTMTSEIDMRKVLDDVGIECLWTDAAVTRNISEPAALPSSFVQRVTVTLDTDGVRPSISEYHNFVPSTQNDTKLLDIRPQDSNSEMFKNFIANRPFMFGIFDSETYTLLFAATFSKPNV